MKNMLYKNVIATESNSTSAKRCFSAVDTFAPALPV
jgi:hypothetical protein